MPGFDWSTVVANSADKVLAGFVGGLVVALFTAIMRYIVGWYQAGKHRDADFHIAATIYTPLDADDPDHAAALSAGKTHVQELLWLGQEVPLSTFLTNAYVLREANAAMSKAHGAGILLGTMPDRAELPFLKKLLGHHNTIPATDLVRLFKKHVEVDADGRVHGISPPTHEHYPGSQHRRVIRAMFIADSQLRDTLPERAKIHFRHEGEEHRYDTIQTITRDYRQKPDRYARCRAYF